MTVKEQLLKLPEMESALRAKKRRLAWMRDTCGSVGAQVITGMPRSPSPPASRMEEAICRMLDLEREIEEDEAALTTMKFRLMQYTDTLKVAEQTAVVERLINGRRWCEVANAMYCSERNAQRYLRSGLEKLSQKDVV